MKKSVLAVVEPSVPSPKARRFAEHVLGRGVSVRGAAPSNLDAPRDANCRTIRIAAVSTRAPPISRRFAGWASNAR